MVETAPPAKTSGLRSLLGDGVLAVGDQAFISGSSLISGLMLAWFSSKEQFGAYALLLGVVLFCQGLQHALITLPMTVLGAARTDQEFRSYFTGLLLAQMALSLVLTLLVLGTWMALRNVPDLVLVSALPATAIALPLVLGQEFLRRVFFTRLRTGSAFLNDLWYSLLRVMGLVALWRLGHGSTVVGRSSGCLDASTVVLVWAIAAAVAMALGFWQLRGCISLSLAGTFGSYRKNWRFGRWTLVELVGSTLTLQGTPWIVGAVCGLQATGLLEGPRLLVAPLQVFWFAGGNLVLPRASRAFTAHGARGLSRFLWRAAPVWAGVFLTWGGLIAVAPQWWIRTVLGSGFAGTAPVLLLWVAIYMVAGATHLPTLGLFALRRPDSGMMVRVLGGLVTVGLTTALALTKGSDWALGGRLAGDVFSLCLATGMLWVMLRSRLSEEDQVASHASARVTVEKN